MCTDISHISNHKETAKKKKGLTATYFFSFKVAESSSVIKVHLKQIYFPYTPHNILPRLIILEGLSICKG